MSPPARHCVVEISDHFTAPLLWCFVFFFPKESLSLEKVLSDNVGLLMLEPPYVGHQES